MNKRLAIRMAARRDFAKPMKKLIKNKFIALVVFVIMFVSLSVSVKVFSSEPGSLSFLYRIASIITTSVSDIIYYLIMQKKYIFDDYTNPNSLIPPNIISGVGAVGSSTIVLTEASSSTTSVSVIPSIIPKVVIKAPATTSLAVKNVEPNYGTPVVISVVQEEPVIRIKPLEATPPVESEVISTPVNSDIYTNDFEILKYTNIERKAESLISLSSNPILDTIASLRVDDLFANQYFEHTSPDGKSASDLAKNLSYEYLLIGENLALGSFDSGKGIVMAWMDSPGHRANILNDKYTELGVSVKEGVFNGDNTIIAVQIFGLPMGDCAKPNPDTKVLIDTLTSSTKLMQNNALVLYSNLTAIKNSPDINISYYNQKIQEYNTVAKTVNENVFTLKTVVDFYNKQVSVYNSCIKP